MTANSSRKSSNLFKWASTAALGALVLSLVFWVAQEMKPTPPMPWPQPTELEALRGTNLTRGQAIFLTRCAVCHGEKGEGKMGANLTDDYWLHCDGRAFEILKITREGVTAKGMPAWERVIAYEDLNAVAVYVESLRGSNPANAKAPQGEKIH